MKILLLSVCKFFLAAIYAVMKLFPAKNKIVFLSRQGNEPGVDFKLLEAEMRESYPEYKTVMLCKKIPGSVVGMVGYAFHILRQMSHLATARLAVLDSYCIPVSLLKHKKSLKVIQIWHSMGIMKRFGFSSVGYSQGRDEKIVKAMNMHKNYDCALCSGPECVAPMAEGFGMDCSRMIQIALPRIDYITKEKYTSASKAAIFSAYPQLCNGKKNIVYVPTFRRGEGLGDEYMEAAFDRVRMAINYEKYNLVIKGHSGEERIFTDSPGNSQVGNMFIGIDFIAVADYVVSDYSTIIFEAAIAQKPIALYCFDWDDYNVGLGFYIDYYKDIPFVKVKTADELMQAIDSGMVVFDEDGKHFSDRFVVRGDYSVSARLAELCDALAKGEFDGVYAGSAYEKGHWKST